jgi:hypothetical protein
MAATTWNGQKTTDLRVLLRVPAMYLDGKGGGHDGGAGAPLKKLGGIVFPYTPTVSFQNQAVYIPQAPTHSMFASYFFKNSNVGPINITGKFTAQNEYEASIILATQTLLRTLVKMRWGDDIGAGSPPPVCRLDAYGNSMLSNVPVAVQSWKLEYPDGVDFIEVGGNGSSITMYGHSFVPTSCTLSLELAVVYSRKEMLDYGVDKYLNGDLDGKGYI